jgi:hypothetical protein
LFGVARLKTETRLEMLAFRRIACGIKPVSLNQVRHGTSIKVVLLEEVQNRGKRGEVVPVKRGFARNYLIPRKMAGMGRIVSFLVDEY